MADMATLERIEDLPKEKPEGLVDYECRTAIRDLIRLDGFDKAREKIAFFLMDECDRTGGRA